MRILLSFYCGIKDGITNRIRIPCFYESFIKELEKTGNELQVYITDLFGRDYNDIPLSLLNSLKTFSPELCIFFNNSFYDVSSIFDCPIVIYEADSPLFYSNKNYLRKYSSRYKFVVTNQENLDFLKNNFGVSKNNILEVTPFSSVNSEKKDIKSNIVFIGTKFYSTKENIYASFMQQKPSNEQISKFKKLIGIYVSDPFISKSNLESIFDKEFVNKYDKFRNEILHSMSDYIRVKTLSCVADLGLRIYGTRSWITDIDNEPDLIMSFVDKTVYSLKDNQDIYNSAKIGININHLQAVSGFSWRVLDILASNSCLVSEYKPNISRFFAKTGIPLFSNHYEARECCKKILSNDNLRQDIVCRSHEIIETNFRFKNVKDRLESFLNLKLEGNYTGETVYYQSMFRLKEKREAFFL